jgi:hypothetical protein
MGSPGRQNKHGVVLGAKDGKLRMTEMEFTARSFRPTNLSAATRWRVFGYLGALAVIVGFADPNEGLLNLPLAFLLKNRLHLQAQDMADFRLIAGIPLYFALLFGFIRDLWHPFGLRDRGYMIFFGLLGATLSLAFLFAPVSPAALLAASLVLTCASLFAAAAQNGLSATIARQHAMTGRMAAVWSIFAMIPWVSALLLGGHVSEALEGSDHGLAVGGLNVTFNSADPEHFAALHAQVRQLVEKIVVHASPVNRKRDERTRGLKPSWGQATRRA